MNLDVLPLVLAFVAGAAVAVAYLALLWAGVRALTRDTATGRFLGLAILRAVLILAALSGAVLLGAGAAEIGTGLVGFVVTRMIATRRADRPDGERQGEEGWR